VADAEYLFEFIAGLFYLIVAVQLLRLAAASHESSQRLLGIAFLFFGVSYVFTEAPFAFEPGTFSIPTLFAGRLLYDVGAVVLALCNREMFQKGERWAAWLVVGLAAMLAAGVGISLRGGDWEGAEPLGNVGFWLEWIGQLGAFVWIAIEACVQCSKARKRAALGLCEPAAFHRYLLLSLFGFIEVCAFFAMIPLYVIYETQNRFYVWMDVLLGMCEILPVLLVWLAFQPPASYRAWIDRCSARKARGAR